MNMSEYSGTFYKNYRAAAGMTQEHAAELLGISVRTLAAYESGERDVPNLRAADMAGLYQNNYLAVQHLRLNAPEIYERVLPEFARVPLSQAVCQLLSAVRAIDQARAGDRLLQIAADGKVDEMEATEYELLMAELEPLIAAVMAVRYAEGV